MDPTQLDAWHMRRALELAALGRGSVEPNPLVGCVIAQGAEVIAEGWHRRFGGPHAEVEALAVAGARAAGGTLYVTLEPCCHQGKTPPCTRAVIAAGLGRVVVAHLDPFPAVAGSGLAELRTAGVQVESGLLEAEARALNAPYLKLLASARPWVLAKWAMTLDGKLAARSGDSRWISGEASRRVVHELRGRVDAILVGRGTAQADDPLLTARPAGPRTARRIVADTRAALPSTSRLVRTARDEPVMVAVGPEAGQSDRARLEAAGCEVFVCKAGSAAARLVELLDELGRRRMTNLLVEGGGTLLGSLFDLRQIDEVHVFISPKLVGGATAPVALAGAGVERIDQALRLESTQWRQLDDDMYLQGRTNVTAHS
ncbi:MAG TPA: bifunctional diaminohydroxyphosphoribosylaminopyrimidine deaminase/5-amino-6-(5-phosphoribosylamino)uracil reductase RibD [Pirellulales bacterium]|jgi:diaminohydroxyphosphoribosylaminopyrimidine deaminase/5-amino-6-(5-phosphoribosylamino)uracil reductase|nr:bifunctional diaminohydroxyphosphoribosylaminopyrimidine deaminase/5-amino-6-(5-phosphoribosylamino)uracil reductase RibD [Pirellulales bacterium]